MGLDQSARETKRRRNSEQIKQKPDELPGLTGAMLRARTRKKAAEVTQLWRHARRPTKYGERAVKAHGSGKWVDLTSAELQLEWKPFNLRLVYVCKMKQQQLHSSVTRVYPENKQFHTFWQLLLLSVSEDASPKVNRSPKTPW